MDGAHAMVQRPLAARDLLAGRRLIRLGRAVCIFDEIDSTNAYLMRQVVAGDAIDGMIAAAEHQSAGRGRLGRRWHASRGASVLLSVLLIEPAGSPLLTRATMLASLAGCEAIDSATGLTAQVRWPNDIVLDGRKLGGVLAESATLPARRDHRALIIGVGINCLQQRGHFPPELAERATSLDIESANAVDRVAVAQQLVDGLDRVLGQQDTPEGWPELAGKWMGRCGDIGQRVGLKHGTHTFRGTVIEISLDGDLVVELDDGGRRHFGAATTSRID